MYRTVGSGSMLIRWRAAGGHARFKAAAIRVRGSSAFIKALVLNAGSRDSAGSDRCCHTAVPRLAELAGCVLAAGGGNAWWLTARAFNAASVHTPREVVALSSRSTLSGVSPTVAAISASGVWGLTGLHAQLRWRWVGAPVMLPTVALAGASVGIRARPGGTNAAGGVVVWPGGSMIAAVRPAVRAARMAPAAVVVAPGRASCGGGQVARVDSGSGSTHMVPGSGGLWREASATSWAGSRPCSRRLSGGSQPVMVCSGCEAVMSSPQDEFRCSRWKSGGWLLAFVLAPRPVRCRGWSAHRFQFQRPGLDPGVGPGGPSSSVLRYATSEPLSVSHSRSSPRSQVSMLTASNVSRAAATRAFTPQRCMPLRTPSAAGSRWSPKRRMLRGSSARDAARATCRRAYAEHTAEKLHLLRELVQVQAVVSVRLWHSSLSRQSRAPLSRDCLSTRARASPCLPRRG